MSIVALDKVSVIGHVRDKDAILEGLQDMGCLHLVPLTAEGHVDEDVGPSKDSREALRFLASTPQRRRQVTDSRRFDALEIQRQALDVQRRTFELRNERDLLSTRIADLAPWGDFEYPPLETLGGQRLWFFEVPRTLIPDVQAGGHCWQVVHTDPRICRVVVISPDEPEGMPVPRIHTGAKSRRELVERLEDVEIALEDLEAERISLTRWCTLLGRAIDGLEDRAARAEAAARTAKADPLFGLQAWIPRNRTAALHSLAKARGAAIEVVPADPDDDPPTLFANAPAMSAGEDLVKFYMTPAYRLWDPSSVVFLSFAVFFGMILADAGYALVIGVLIAAYWKRMGRSETGKRMRVMAATMIGATGVYGVMTGSYFGVSPSKGSFGDILHVLDLGNFSVMMAVSIVIGVAHIAYACVMDALRFAHWPQRFPSLGWALFMVGGLALWGGQQLGNQAVLYGGLGAMGVSVLLIVGFTGYGEKPLKRIVKGLTALTAVSGAFGDVMSYLRLFALGLASASLAGSFNDMAGQLRDAVPGIGLLLAILVLLLGHALNMVLSVASGFIHGLRLNVIEFFKWGVKDEGNPYRPFERKESASWKTSS